MLAIVRHGLEVLSDAPPARRRRLLEAAAFYDFLLERCPRSRMSGALAATPCAPPASSPTPPRLARIGEPDGPRHGGDRGEAASVIGRP